MLTLGLYLFKPRVSGGPNIFKYIDLVWQYIKILISKMYFFMSAKILHSTEKKGREILKGSGAKPRRGKGLLQYG